MSRRLHYGGVLLGYFVGSIPSRWACFIANEKHGFLAQYTLDNVCCNSQCSPVQLTMVLRRNVDGVGRFKMGFNVDSLQGTELNTYVGKAISVQAP